MPRADKLYRIPAVTGSNLLSPGSQALVPCYRGEPRTCRWEKRRDAVERVPLGEVEGLILVFRATVSFEGRGDGQACDSTRRRGTRSTWCLQV
ncbi:hypothetical protein PIB30_039030 [Stylosanthes scabra]|uniref:Uncharacterized protein n=1 Tax=Stylosanthes scabra TaxID=79078 RepID=A0ABU6REU7_9FABA|nr:hypothetical protein [Stylosanthes scabra]